MDKQTFDIKKYPKSKNNFQCLGPCYYPGTVVVHPTHLEIVTNNIKPFCPVDEWEQEDPKTGKNVELIIDQCMNPTEKTNTSNRELELNILTPYIDFNAEHFLKIYYNIFSFEDSVDWINKNGHVSINTKIRIINASLKIFGESIEIFESTLSDFFIEYLKKKEIREIYLKISKYVGVDSSAKNIKLINDTKNNLSVNDYCVERTNYIIKTFMDKEEIMKFLVRYFKYKNEKWKEIHDHLKKMSNDFILYILNKIATSLSGAI